MLHICWQSVSIYKQHLRSTLQKYLTYGIQQPPLLYGHMTCPSYPYYTLCSLVLLLLKVNIEFLYNTMGLYTFYLLKHVG